MKTVQWLQEALSLTFEQEMKFEGLFQQAKEMEKQQQDEFAIGFADWIRVCRLKGRPYDFNDVKQLLEIYKDEKDL
jgi:hypothetical protein